MLKKLFDWTPRDIAYWEKIQARGLGSFILMYGVVTTGGLLFVIFGLFTLIGWLRQLGGIPVTPTRLFFLAFQLLVVALVCLAAGLLNAILTWVVEQRLYRKYKGRQIME